MLVLIWCKEKSVREELLKTYWQLYINEYEFKSEQVAWNLINIFNTSSLAEITSLEELLYVYLDQPLQVEDQNKKKEIYTIHPPVFRKLWDVFIQGLQANNFEMKLPQGRDKTQTRIDRRSMRSALQILRIAYSKDKDLFSDKLDTMNMIVTNFVKSEVLQQTLKFCA